MSQLLTDLDRKIGAVVAHDACRSLPGDQGLAVALPYHLEALPQGPQGIDQGILLMWVLLHVVNRLSAQVDRLERLVAGLIDRDTRSVDAFAEDIVLELELRNSVRARREAEAKARADVAAAGGVQ